MKKLMLATAVAATFLAPQAFAQSKSFEGASVGLTANLNNTKIEALGASVSDSSTTVGINAAYGMALSGKFNLTFGLSYDLGKAKAFSGTTGEIYAKETMILSVAPGFKVSDSTLVYAKLGYATTKGVAEPVGAAATSENYTGTAYGLGVRTMLAKNWSAGLEFQQLDFSSKDGVKPSATVTSLGVSYHF